MPTIKKLPKKKENYPKRGLNKDIAKIYNSTQWKKLRNAYYMEHPLCEMCLAENVLHPVATSEIHHKIPISTGKDEWSMKALCYDPDNLMALCEYHHHLVHKRVKSR